MKYKFMGQVGLEEGEYKLLKIIADCHETLFSHFDLEKPALINQELLLDSTLIVDVDNVVIRGCIISYTQKVEYGIKVDCMNGNFLDITLNIP